MIVSDGPMEVVAIPTPPTSFQTGLPNRIRFGPGLASDISPFSPEPIKILID
jgi:hypothetical protein